MPRGRKRKFTGYVPRPWIHNSSSEFEDDDAGANGVGQELRAPNVGRMVREIPVDDMQYIDEEEDYVHDSDDNQDHNDGKKK